MMKSQGKYRRDGRLSKKVNRQTKSSICQALASGRSLTSICSDEKYPCYDTVQRMLRADEDFRKEFEIARDIYYQKAADQLFDIADDSTNDYVDRRRSDGSTVRAFDKEAVMRSTLRIDTRKWVLAKMLPKMYGAKELDSGTAGKIIGDLKDLIHEVVQVARDTRPAIEAEVIDEVKQIADKEN